MIAETMFREYDIRGRVNPDELNEESIALIGRAFGTKLVRMGIDAVALGFDSRESSPSLRDAMVDALVSTGCHVVDVGMVVSPVLYFAQNVFGIDGGVMITASHNPPEWNGLKLSSVPSVTLVRKELQEVLDLAERQDFVSGQGSVETRPIKDRYISDLTGRVTLRRGLRLVVDAGNGTAGPWALDLLRAAGCEVDCLFCDLDPSFPNHFPNPSDLTTLRTLQDRVKATDADIGLAFDGDGDRLGVVDEKGKIVYMDRVVILLARQVLERQPGAKIVFDVKCTEALVEDIEEHGGVPVMWITGHSWMKAKMHDEKAALAGERSGHIAFPPDWSKPGQPPGRDFYYGFDDALFSALRLLEFMSQQDRPLSALVAEVDRYITSPEIEVPCPDTEKYTIVGELLADFKQEYEKVIDVNGARVYMHGGWGLVRASSNLPALVLIFEAPTLEQLKLIRDVFKQKLAAHGCTSPWKGDMDIA